MIYGYIRTSRTALDNPNMTYDNIHHWQSPHPAHAGIDPLHGCPEIGLRATPRPCGDRPTAGQWHQKWLTHTPRDWGSTTAYSGRENQTSAYPTRLGINQTSHQPGFADLGTPHATGDQPLTDTHGRGDDWHTPRDWGSTLLETLSDTPENAHPTRLGINRWPNSKWDLLPYTPQAIGDQP